MAEATLTHSKVETGRDLLGRINGIAWRNLWRNRRRTWLTAGGIAFAVFLLVFARSSQEGSFVTMIDNTARLMGGHLQYQHPAYEEDPRIENLLHGVGALRADLARHPDIEFAVVRAEGFALVSAGERSFGGQVVGVEPAEEAAWSTLARSIDAGRYLEGPGEVLIGAVLAQNLGLTVGDDVVMLGTAVEGGVAAAAGTLVGTFATGIVEVDRSMVQIHLTDFRDAWALPPDSGHRVVAVTDGVYGFEHLARQFAAADRRGLDWTELMPELVQMVDMKMVGTDLFFALIAVIVIFSVVNTFMMTVFERTPEFGMMLAIGARPGSIMLQLQLEALWLMGLGVGLGVGISLLLITLLGSVGIPLPADAAEMTQQFNMPDRIYPAFDARAAWIASIVMLVGTQIAAVIPALRIRRLRVVEALRGLE